MSSELVATIITESDRNVCVDRLLLLEKALYTQSELPSQVAAEILPENQANIIAEALKKPGVNYRKTILQFIKELKQLEVVNITMAEEYPRSLLITFHQKLTSILKNPVVIKIQIRSDLLAGAIIEFQGRFIDASLSKRISEYFDANRAKIMKEITKGL
ncbi:hypothetical protein C4579_01165 [Candidatus Microgenomates bacterium]|nr:MAG: hypothetical protein C4579_01165 [Candidatus Microgenomates bacterium]